MLVLMCLSLVRSCLRGSVSGIILMENLCGILIRIDHLFSLKYVFVGVKEYLKCRL